MHISELLKDRRVQGAGIGVITFAGGVGLGYFLGLRRRADEVLALQIQNDNLSDSLNAAVEMIDIPMVDPELERLLAEEEVIAREESESRSANMTKYTELVTDYMVDEEETDEPVPSYTLVTNTISNVFTKDEDDIWDFEAELSSRTHDEPYIIHVDEYMADEMGFQQETLIFYVHDGVMANQKDEEIHNYQGLMGADLNFGHGSKDKNLVFIRNEVLHMEWEIIQHHGSFEIEVLGKTIEDHYQTRELKHSHSVHKFRDF